MRIAVLPIDKQEAMYDEAINISTEIAYIICSLEQNNPDDLIFPAFNVSFLAISKPDVICIYAPYSSTFEYVIEVSDKAKRKYNKPVILLGDHISAIPKSLPVSSDVGVLGDPEETLVKVIELIRSNSFDDKNLAKIPALVFHNKNRKIITSPPQYIENIESLPMTQGVFHQMPGKWTPSIISGRGKPSNNDWDILTNQPVRLFSIDKIMKDVADIIVNNKKNKVIPIKDTLFLYDKVRFKKFVAMYEETKLSQYMHFEINSMIYQLDEEIIHDLKKVLDIPKLTINFLSPTEKPYKEMKDSFVPYKEQQKILDLCFKYNLNVDAKFMYNFPLETIEDVTKTYWIIKRNYLKKYNNLSISAEPYVALPGSKNWLKMSAKKVITESFNNWQSLKTYNNETPSISYIKSVDIPEIKKEFDKFNIQRNDSFAAELEKPNKAIENMKDQLFGNIQELRGNLSKMSVHEIDLEEIDINELINKPIKMPDSLLIVLEEILKLNVDNDDQEVRNKINQAKKNYYNINDDKLHHKLFNSDSITYLTLDSIFSKITKNTNIKSVLQVFNKNILDLKNIFKNDYLDLDYLDTNYFNKPSLNNKLEKEYDMILLYFTVNNVVSLKETLKFCSKNLKEDGVLVISFFNTKNLINLIRIFTDLNVNDWFYGYKRTKDYTVDSINEQLLNNGFKVNSIDNIDFPNVRRVSLNSKVFYETLSKDVSTVDTEKLFYVFTCRKI